MFKLEYFFICFYKEITLKRNVSRKWKRNKWKIRNDFLYFYLKLESMFRNTKNGNQKRWRLRRRKSVCFEARKFSVNEKTGGDCKKICKFQFSFDVKIFAVCLQCIFLSLFWALFLFIEQNEKSRSLKARRERKRR